MGPLAAVLVPLLCGAASAATVAATTPPPPVPMCSELASPKACVTERSGCVWNPLWHPGGCRSDVCVPAAAGGSADACRLTEVEASRCASGAPDAFYCKVNPCEWEGGTCRLRRCLHTDAAACGAAAGCVWVGGGSEGPVQALVEACVEEDAVEDSGNSGAGAEPERQQRRRSQRRRRQQQQQHSGALASSGDREGGGGVVAAFSGLRRWIGSVLRMTTHCLHPPPPTE
eukprot:Rhum_TRINITY_DN11718_c1_g1::Rhum_TRINITY_DN11718_c1_g1_i1::g.46501::m.46501